MKPPLKLLLHMRYCECGLLVLLTALSGCGSGPQAPDFVQNLVPVSGQVVLNGQPVSGATVLFLAPPSGAGAGEIAEARTDVDGRYVLSTRMARARADERKGVLPGEYVVAISRIVMPDGSPLPPGTTEADALAVGAIESVPAKYNDPETTPLRVTVTEDSPTFDFELN